MSAIMRGNMKIALASVRSNKWRSLLTMLGIIIGIVSVVTVVGIGEGVKHQIAQQINHFGKDLITVRPGYVPTSASRHSLTNTDLLFGLNSVNGLNDHDLQTVQKSSHVRIAAPLSLVPGTVATADRQLTNSLVLGTNANLQEALNQSVQYGDFLDADSEDQNVAVIGHGVASSLFNDNVPLGQHFTFRGETFIVRGMFSAFQGTPLSPASNFNEAIFIPFQTAERLTGNGAQMYTILAKPDRPANTAAAIKFIQDNLYQAHGNQRDFSVLNSQQSVEASGNVLSLLTTLIAGVAAISLLVGGVGIMNIMLVSVTERMHEIGVRKAIGATNRQILNQFLAEAMVLSVSGGVLGIAASLLVDLLLRVYTSFKPVISWQAVVIATVVSVAIGLVFGTAPAAKAASKDPIQALRHE